MLKNFSFCIAVTLSATALAQTKLPEEHALWPSDKRSTIQYEQELTRAPNASEHAPSGSNRVFTDISKPTYSIHRPDASKANGVGLVICPGGGYTDVWLDREGHDLAIWLKEYGVTSLVLKYRTNGKGDINGRKYDWNAYMPEVVADARQAVRTLRGQATELKLAPDRIGICGFSAGGNLALQVAVFKTHDKKGANSDVSSKADFAGLFYPWLRTDLYQTVELKNLPPMFIMNAADDTVTPAAKCVDFYGRLLEAKARPELHIVLRGGHGFDLGEGKGESARLWKTSFVAWMKDVGLEK